jgi:hypothetical protein
MVRNGFRSRDRSKARIGLLLVAVAALGACSSTTQIGDLLADPGRYDGRKVRVEGEVGSSVGLLGHGAYQIDDGTGSLPVVSKQFGVPAQRTHVTVEGIFHALFTLGSRSVAILEQTRSVIP